MKRLLILLVWAVSACIGHAQSSAEERISAKLSMVTLFPIEGGNLYIQEEVAKENAKKEEPPTLRVQVANFRMLNPTYYKGGRKVLVFE